MANFRTIATNRKAFHDYEIYEKVEAGLVLTGTEIKSIRAGRVNLGDSFAKPERGELWIVNMHVSPYPQGGLNNHEPYRPRKLLLHREQVEDLAAQASQKGLTLVPLRLYIKDHHAKMEIGIGRGRRRYDKRKVIGERDANREIQRALRHAASGR